MITAAHPPTGFNSIIPIAAASPMAHNRARLVRLASSPKSVKAHRVPSPLAFLKRTAANPLKALANTYSNANTPKYRLSPLPATTATALTQTAARIISEMTENAPMCGSDKICNFLPLSAQE